MKPIIILTSLLLVAGGVHAADSSWPCRMEATTPSANAAGYGLKGDVPTERRLPFRRAESDR